MAAICFKSFGNTVGIVTGQMLGANNSPAAVRDTNRKMTALSVFAALIFGGMMAALCGVFPQMYQATDTVKALATGLILIAAVDVLFQGYIYPVYFTLRAGGKTGATFLFDCGSIWLLCLPAAYFLSHYTDIHVLVIYGIVIGLDFVKCLVGFFMVRSDSWIRNLTVN